MQVNVWVATSFLPFFLNDGSTRDDKDWLHFSHLEKHMSMIITSLLHFTKELFETQWHWNVMFKDMQFWKKS